MTNIVWRRLDVPGHEAARLVRSGNAWELDGAAVFIEDGARVRLDYRVVCDAEWRTRSAYVSGWVGEREINIAIAVADDERWLVNGREEERVRGCIDVDLNFSPSTNLLPVRRLNLNVGEEAIVRAAWLVFPTFELQVLEQRYRRTAKDRYEYDSGDFTAAIRVNEHGLAIEYAGLWVEES